MDNKDKNTAQGKLPNAAQRTEHNTTESSFVSLILNTTRKCYYIIAKSSIRRHVQIIFIDPATGSFHRPKRSYGDDMFPTEEQAMQFLADKGSLQVVARGKHILGYIVISHIGLLLLAEKVRTSATLPGKHYVRTVTAAKWHRIPLTMPPSTSGSSTPTGGVNPSTSATSTTTAASPGGTADPESLMTAAQKEEFNKGVEKITTFPIENVHYFCETLDITRPFPSYHPPMHPSWEFVWNRWLSTSFQQIGLDHLCPPLLQGMAEDRLLNDYDGLPYCIALISRRGRLHVGPRYKARGLNDMAEPANEIEVEQVVWRPGVHERDAISWARYTWRRGSVPLWWGVHMKNQGLGEAEIRIKDTCTFRGSRRFVRRLQKRYCPVSWLEPDGRPWYEEKSKTQPPSLADSGEHATVISPQLSTTAAPSLVGLGNATASLMMKEEPPDPSKRVPVVFVSLLRKGTPDRDRSEAKLAAAFDFMANAVKKTHALPVQYIALDWHELDKQLGSHELVSAFWGTIREILKQQGFAYGTMSKVGMDHTDYGKQGSEPPEDGGYGKHPEEGCISTSGLGWQARWMGQQKGIVRYNCADSLDRTNVGSFFGAVQVMVEMCRCLDVAIAVAPKSVNSIATVMRKQHAGGSAAGGPGGKDSTGAPGGDSKSLSKLAPKPVQPNASPNGSQHGGNNAGSSLAMGINKFLNAVSPRAGSSSAGIKDLNTVDSGADAGPSLARRSMPVTSMTSKSPPIGNSPQKNGNNALVHAASVTSSGWQHQGTGSNLPSTNVSPARERSVHDGNAAAAGSVTTPSGYVTPGTGWGGGCLTIHAVLDEITRTLLPGWEVKVDNKTDKLFYVDHNTRTTHWTHPTLTQAAVDQLCKPPAPVRPLNPPLAPSPTPSQSDLMSFTQSTLLPTTSTAGTGSSLMDMSITSSSMFNTPLGSAGPSSLLGPGGGQRPQQKEEVKAWKEQRPADDGKHVFEPLSPWCMLKNSVKAFKQRVHPDCLFHLAHLFLCNGDMSAYLYTGSQAMHSERLLIFEPENSILRKQGVGAAGNIMVGIKRRYNNVMVDTERQQQLEVFLGMKHSVYFPNTRLMYKEDCSTLIEMPETDDDEDPLSQIDFSSEGKDAGTPQQGHNRNRNRSYTSTELDSWRRGSSAVPTLRPTLEGTVSTCGIEPTRTSPQLPSLPHVHSEANLENVRHSASASQHQYHSQYQYAQGFGPGMGQHGLSQLGPRSGDYKPGSPPLPSHSPVHRAVSDPAHLAYIESTTALHESASDMSLASRGPLTGEDSGLLFGVALAGPGPASSSTPTAGISMRRSNSLDNVMLSTPSAGAGNAGPFARPVASSPRTSSAGDMGQISNTFQRVMPSRFTAQKPHHQRQLSNTSLGSNSSNGTADISEGGVAGGNTGGLREPARSEALTSMFKQGLQGFKRMVGKDDK